jgi:hypothetical protein
MNHLPYSLICPKKPYSIYEVQAFAFHMNSMRFLIVNTYGRQRKFIATRK